MPSDSTGGGGGGVAEGAAEGAAAHDVAAVAAPEAASGTPKRSSSRVRFGEHAQMMVYPSEIEEPAADEAAAGATGAGAAADAPAGDATGSSGGSRHRSQRHHHSRHSRSGDKEQRRERAQGLDEAASAAPASPSGQSARPASIASTSSSTSADEDSSPPGAAPSPPPTPSSPAATAAVATAAAASSSGALQLTRAVAEGTASTSSAASASASASASAARTDDDDAYEEAVGGDAAADTDAAAVAASVADDDDQEDGADDDDDDDDDEVVDAAGVVVDGMPVMGTPAKGADDEASLEAAIAIARSLAAERVRLQRPQVPQPREPAPDREAMSKKELRKYIRCMFGDPIKVTTLRSWEEDFAKGAYEPYNYQPDVFDGTPAERIERQKFFAMPKLKSKDLPGYDAAINSKVYLFHGDLAALDVDLVVVPTGQYYGDNTGGSFGVEKALLGMGGEHLQYDRFQMGRMPPGRVRVTSGYRVPARRVAFAAVPIGVKGRATQKERMLLATCYVKVLRYAADNGIRNIAFSALGTSMENFRYGVAALVAASNVRKWLENPVNAGKIDRVVFVTYPFVEAHRSFMRVLATFFPGPGDSRMPPQLVPEPRQCCRLL